MASGRVGGTKSKVSGTIGSEVYSLRRNPDGTYSQVVSAKPETTTYTNTEKQAAQRMVTAMIEAMMRDLTPVARISMQSGVNPSKSLNAFSSFNLNKVREDMIANWYGNQKFVYPIKDSDVKLGGIYTISAGTLQLMQGEVNNIGWSYDGWGLNGHKWFNKRVNHWVGIQKRCVCSDDTLGTLLRESNMLRSDVFVSVCNREYFIYNPELEEDEIVYKYDYVIAKLKDTLPDSTTLDELESDDVWEVTTNCDAIFHFCKDELLFTVGSGIPFDNHDDHILYYANFMISRRDGTRKISSSVFKNVYGGESTWLIGHAPTNVFYSWLGEHMDDHWPSPF